MFICFIGWTKKHKICSTCKTILDKNRSVGKTNHKNEAEILKRYENSLHKFHRCVSDWLTMSLCETSGFTEGSPSFTPANSGKLGESWWKHKVSPGRAVYQRVIVRWNLWRLFSYLFYFSDFSMVLDSVQEYLIKRLDVFIKTPRRF